MTAVRSAQLDIILALQFTVGWAGERAAEPERLGWWNTDLTDELAGGDLFSRLLPKTAAWAGLELARQAALRADQIARGKLAQPDAVTTLFHWGFELDEAIQDRLNEHKRQGRNPNEVFREHGRFGSTWSRDEFESFLRSQGEPKTEETPAGRRVKKLSENLVEAARALVAALLPLSSSYPLPHGARGQQ